MNAISNVGPPDWWQIKLQASQIRLAAGDPPEPPEEVPQEDPTEAPQPSDDVPERPTETPDTPRNVPL